ncbi:hypothetical protein FDP41_006026 [Naegleria fowleri]|uniref:RCK C-terminal domain-containing protein n=1 Tax=Naegleria fowleri TaxID=5763 RepID=A0A6A5BKN3_NAEFO|nr:uncharacterized protein FDP41_006026 [Naegleria fowleri]KAF0974921.1 hypothetical protein FDP41_006026 [Naegleria fowleri]
MFSQWNEQPSGLFVHGFQFSTQFTRVNADNTTERLALMTFSYSSASNILNWDFIFDKIGASLTKTNTNNTSYIFQYFRLIHSHVIKNTEYGNSLFLPEEIFQSSTTNSDGIPIDSAKMKLDLNGWTRGHLKSASDLLEIPELYKNNYYLQWFSIRFNTSLFEQMLMSNDTYRIQFNESSIENITSSIYTLFQGQPNPSYTFSTLKVIRNALLIENMTTSSDPVTNICSSVSPVIAFAWSSWKLWFVLICLIIMLVLLILSVWRPYVVIICTVVIFNIAGILTLDQTVNGFANGGTLAIALLFPIVKPLTQNTLVKKFAKLLFGSPIPFKNSNRFLQLVSYMIPTLRMCLVFATIGAFVNNTPVVVLGLPIVLEWTKHNKVSASKFLITLTYITSGSGFLTLIGNSSNIVANGIYTTYGYSPLTFYEFFYLGSVLCLITIIYLITYGLWIVPDEVRGVNNAQRASIRFANRFSSIRPPMKDRHELFVAVVRMSNLANQEKHTKPFKLYVNLLGKNEAQVMKVLGLEGVELVEIIRTPLNKESTTTNAVESPFHPQTPHRQSNHSKDDSTTSEEVESVVIEIAKEMEPTNIPPKEPLQLRIRIPIPQNVVIEKDDILIFKGSPKSILLLQAMTFEQDSSMYNESTETTNVISNQAPRKESSSGEEFNEIPQVVIQERIVNSSHSYSSVASDEDLNSPSNISVHSVSSNDRLVSTPSFRENYVLDQLHQNLKKSLPTEISKEDKQTAETNKKQKDVDKIDSKSLEFFEVVIGPSNPCVGEEYQEFEKRYRVTVLAIRNLYFNSETNEQDLKKLTVNTGDTLLVVGKTNFYFNFHESHREFYMISRFSEVSPSYDAFKSKPFLVKIPFSKRILDLWWWEHWIFLFFFAMIASTIAGFSMVQCSFICFCVVIAFGLISPSAAIDSVDWGLVALVGASFGIGTAITQSGVGQGITEVLKIANIPPILLPAFITAITLIVANHH